MFDITKAEAIKYHLYYQYQDVPALEELFEVIRKFINREYFGLVLEMVRDTSVENARSNYLSFWSQYFLGLYKPLGAASANLHYDTEEQYDGIIQYDEADVYDGTISLEHFKHYLKFILDYSREIINLDTFVSFIVEQIGCVKADVVVEQTWDGITLRVPQTQGSSDFLRLYNAYYNDLGLPYGVKLGVRYINSLATES